MRCFEIIWRDISHDSGWHSTEELKKYVDDKVENLVTHVAYLHSESEEEYFFVDSYLGDKEQWGVIHKIPKGTILRMTEMIKIKRVDE